MTNKEVVQKARKLISDKNNWVTGRNSEDINGVPVNSKDDKACRWCAEGAINKYAENYTQEREIILKFLVMHHKSLWVINDTFGHERVLQVLDEYN